LCLNLRHSGRPFILQSNRASPGRRAVARRHGHLVELHVVGDLGAMTRQVLAPLTRVWLALAYSFAFSLNDAGVQDRK
jgi:hypothetical protein